jgi:hypothetical protein
MSTKKSLKLQQAQSGQAATGNIKAGTTNFAQGRGHELVEHDIKPK